MPTEPDSKQTATLVSYSLFIVTSQSAPRATMSIPTPICPMHVTQHKQQCTVNYTYTQHLYIAELPCWALAASFCFPSNNTSEASQVVYSHLQPLCCIAILFLIHVPHVWHSFPSNYHLWQWYALREGVAVSVVLYLYYSVLWKDPNFIHYSHGTKTRHI